MSEANRGSDDRGKGGVGGGDVMLYLGSKRQKGSIYLAMWTKQCCYKHYHHQTQKRKKRNDAQESSKQIHTNLIHPMYVCMHACACMYV